MRLIFQHNTDAVARAIERRGDESISRIDQALGRGAHEVAREVVRRAPKFRSRIATSTGATHAAPLEWHVDVAARHAGYVERETGPGGRPPLAEIVDWIRLKGITPRTPGVTQESLAHLIRRSIARFGTEAQPYAEPALDTMRPRLVELVTAAAQSSLAGDR